MTLEEMKHKVYSLIEEYSEDAADLTEDEDLASKINGVINSIQNELTRFKKIPKDVTINVSSGQEMYFKDIDKDLYQLMNIRGVSTDILNDKIFFNEDGEAKIFYYKYPKQITNETDDSYKFELPTDLLEIMPYGVAGDILKSDVSSQYGAVYSARYREMLQTLDPRYGTGIIEITGGINI